jgi:hypothetical protein
LELTQRGFSPEATCADAAAGLRCGQEQALPGVPCQGDVFHALREVGRLVRSLESRAYQALDTLQKLQRQQARHEYRQGRKSRSVAQKQAAASVEVERALALADDVAVLAGWQQFPVKPSESSTGWCRGSSWSGKWAEGGISTWSSRPLSTAAAAATSQGAQSG